MHHILAKNVNEAYYLALNSLRKTGVKQDSRNGPVLTFPYPLVTRYRYPRERVLFCAKRNANPFFHLMEALWMLDGRRDLGWIKRFNQRFGEYSDDGKIVTGAYGYRWRHKFGYDQIDTIIKKLEKNPLDRRVVLQMWDATDDLRYEGKDAPCNTHVYFRVVGKTLDATVCNRSNDLIWGLYGANAVHMSIMQEYVAACLGLEPGYLYTWSNNPHAYIDVLERVGEPELQDDLYSHAGVRAEPLFGGVRRQTFEADLWSFMDDLQHPGQVRLYATPFFNNVAQRVALAWFAYKAGDWASVWLHTAKIDAEDWNIACTQWMKRAHERRDAETANVAE